MEKLLHAKARAFNLASSYFRSLLRQKLTTIVDEKNHCLLSFIIQQRSVESAAKEKIGAPPSPTFPKYIAFEFLFGAEQKQAHFHCKSQY
jgi:hypothetical protein